MLKLAANAVTSNAILNGAVTDLKLANDAVTTAKIQDGAVTAAKLAPNSVSGGTGGVIADLSITNADISNTAAISHTKLDFTGWTVPANMVNTASIQNNAVTNGKIDIDLGGALPYITFVGKSDTNLSTSATQFLFPVGKVTPSTSDDLWTNIEGCTKFALKVQLTAAPGGSASRTFRIHNGSGTIGTACTITGSSTSCATSEFTVTLPSAFQISSEVSGSPNAAGASWVLACSQ